MDNYVGYFPGYVGYSFFVWLLMAIAIGVTSYIPKLEHEHIKIAHLSLWG